MGHRIGCVFWASAAMAAAASMTAAPASALAVHLPGHHPKVVIPTEGSWLVHAGQVQDLYANIGHRSLALQAYFCVTPKPGPAPQVDLLQGGRAPIEIQGCQSVYLLLAPGDRIALAASGAADATGTYKLDLQGQLK